MRFVAGDDSLILFVGLIKIEATGGRSLVNLYEWIDWDSSHWWEAIGKML
jgi:hypothetical protein